MGHGTLPHRALPLAVVALAVVAAGCAAPFGDQPAVDDAPADGLPDPASDRLGWEDGRWYNETVDVSLEDGLDESERRAVVARAMARVERIRGLEFRSRVPVRVITRHDFRQRVSQRSIPPAERRFENARYEAVFMVNESADAAAVKRGTTASSVAGFYSPRGDVIVIVTPPGAPARIDEFTLAHELVHALQDQRFGFPIAEARTLEDRNARAGLVEGDANLVQHLYEQRCRGAWNGTCVVPTAPADPGGESTGGLGPYLLKYQPYSDGPAFVRSIRRERGWAGVNAAYDDPPASTEQTIHPPLYGRDAPSRVVVRDRSGPAWRRVRPDRVDRAEFGEAGLFAMLVYPAIESGGERAVVPADRFFTGDRGIDPYDYSHPYSAGWDGDALVAYASDSTPAGETGYVWKTAWDSEAQAAEFVEGYRALLRLHGARRASGAENTWVISDGGYADAFRIERRGATVVVVNAPTVDDLDGVRRPG